MAEKDSRRGAVDPGVILMVLAFAVIGGFMFWLYGQAAEEQAMNVVEEAVEEAVDPLADATTVSPLDLQPDASGLEGELVRVVGVEVAGPLGEQGFWLSFPQGPFLVSISEPLRADDFEVVAEAMVAVTGTVVAMNDSIVSAWVESGRISEGDAPLASFATHFVLAERVESN